MKKAIAMLAAACTLTMALPVGVYAEEASGKTDLVIAVDADVDTLHPTDFSTTVELNILDQLYDTLMYLNPDGTHDPEPRIA